MQTPASTAGSAEGSFRQYLKTASWALKLAWPHHALSLSALILTTVGHGLFPAAFAVVMRGFINSAVQAANNSESVAAQLAPWLLGALAITTAESISRLLDRFFRARLLDDVHLNITSTILRHAANLDVAYFENPRFQDVVQRARQNTAGEFSSFLTSGLAIATTLIQVASLAAVLVVIDPLVVVVLTPLAGGYLVYESRLAKLHYLDEYQRATKRRWTQYFVGLLTTRQSVPEVKALRLAPMLVERFRSISEEFRDRNRTRYASRFRLGVGFTVLMVVAFYAVFARVASRYVGGALSVGDLAVFATAGLRLRSALEAVVPSTANALKTALYVENLRAFLEIRPRIREAPQAVSPVSTRGEIAFRDVSFIYPGAKTPALVNVSLSVQPGETVALVGENGAGKTTLVRLLARFYDPQEGRILWDGIDLRELSLDYLHRHIALVAQGFGRYEASARDNIALGDWSRLRDDPAEVERVARATGVHDLIAQMPQGYDTMLGRSFGGFDLSAGQWQQLAVARAFARRPTLLVLDEPTSNLDVKAEYEMFLRFSELARGKTTILISHRFSTIRMADRIIVLSRGRVVETGAHHELIARGGTMPRFTTTTRGSSIWPRRWTRTNGHPAFHAHRRWIRSCRDSRSEDQRRDLHLEPLWAARECAGPSRQGGATTSRVVGGTGGEQRLL